MYTSSTSFIFCPIEGSGSKAQGQIVSIVVYTIVQYTAVGHLDHVQLLLRLGKGGGDQKSGSPGAVQAKTRLSRYLWQASDG